MDLSKYTKSEISDMRVELNLTDDEAIVFDMLAKGKSIMQIADKLNLSTRSIDNRIAKIRKKINRI
jgi:DNA-binding NarL/FixJ family response regulator